MNTGWLLCPTGYWHPGYGDNVPSAIDCWRGSLRGHLGVTNLMSPTGSSHWALKVGLCCQWSSSRALLPAVGVQISKYITCTCQVFIGAGLACWWERWTRNQKVAGSNPGRSSKIFFSRVYFVCWLIFGVCSTPVLPQWHIKDPSHSAQSAGGRLHLNMRTPLTPWSQSGLTMPLSRHSLGTYREMRLHATCQGTVSHSPFSSPSPCGLILA